MKEQELLEVLEELLQLPAENECVEFKEGEKEDFEKILLDKLPDVLDIKKKQNKIKNNLQSLRKQGIIKVNGKMWVMSKTEK